MNQNHKQEENVFIWVASSTISLDFMLTKTPSLAEQPSRLYSIHFNTSIKSQYLYNSYTIPNTLCGCYVNIYNIQYYYSASVGYMYQASFETRNGVLATASGTYPIQNSSRKVNLEHFRGDKEKVEI